MMMIYKLRADIVTDEAGRKRVVYGVDVYQRVRSVPDVFTDDQQALAFLELCNESQPCQEQLDDLLHDAVIK